ncbi:MAG: hypothetical protein C4346_09105 [Chloroflexota bacterium]
MFAKHDLILAYQGRTFAIRAYHDGSLPEAGGWHAVIIENRTPVQHERGGHDTAAQCLAKAVSDLATMVDWRSASTALAERSEERFGNTQENPNVVQEESHMPRYEFVAHLAVDSDAATPEQAAQAFKRTLLTEMGSDGSLLGLAVWRIFADPAPVSLPASLRQQLVDFFKGVAESADLAEDAFRTRVAQILAETTGDAGLVTSLPQAEPLTQAPATEAWESEGGSVAGGRDEKDHGMNGEDTRAPIGRAGSRQTNAEQESPGPVKLPADARELPKKSPKPPKPRKVEKRRRFRKG